MAVIINDFEVETEQPETGTEGGGEVNETRTETRLTPGDINDILYRHAQRMARIAAH